MLHKADVLIDTSILLYAALGRKAEKEKFTKAQQIILGEDYGTSTDILSEFYVLSTSVDKWKTALSAQKAQEWIDVISKKPCQAIDIVVMKKALYNNIKFTISYRNASNIAAAERLGATTIYTEYLNHGSIYGNVKAINPFISGE